MSYDLSLVPTKHSGNFMIFQKKDKKRVLIKLSNVYLPFGIEHFDGKKLLNIVIDNSNNYAHNNIVNFKNIINTFEEMKDTFVGRIKYKIDDKEFFNFLTKLENSDEEIKENEEENLEVGDDIAKKQNLLSRYLLRTYLKNGVNITHKKMIGNLGLDYDLKGKNCDITVELGSMWVREDTKQYGVNIYVLDILVH